MTNRYTATIKGTLIPGALEALYLQLPLDLDWAATVYTIDQLTLAGAEPYDTWHVAQWLARQRGEYVTRVYPWVLDLWFAVTGERGVTR